MAGVVGNSGPLTRGSDAGRYWRMKRKASPSRRARPPTVPVARNLNRVATRSGSIDTSTLREQPRAAGAKPGTSINLYRRNVQRAYLDNMDERLNGQPAASAEVRALVKGELRALDRQLQTAAAAPGLDEGTRRHLVDARDSIAIILDPTVPRPAPAAGGDGGGRGGRGGIR